MKMLLSPKTIAVLGFIASAQTALAADITVSEAWVRETVGNAKVSAGYAHITNNSAAPDHLTGVKTEIAGIADVHKSMDEGGMMKMDAVKDVEVPAKGSVDLKPGGFHIMLMKVTRPLKAGDTVNITFTFQHAGNVTALAKVAPISATKAP